LERQARRLVPPEEVPAWTPNSFAAGATAPEAVKPSLTPSNPQPQPAAGFCCPRVAVPLPTGAPADTCSDYEAHRATGDYGGNAAGHIRAHGRKQTAHGEARHPT